MKTFRLTNGDPIGVFKTARDAAVAYFNSQAVILVHPKGWMSTKTGQIIYLEEA